MGFWLVFGGCLVGYSRVLGGFLVGSLWAPMFPDRFLVGFSRVPGGFLLVFWLYLRWIGG